MRALVIVDINDPLKPVVVRQIPLRNPKAVAIQFRYAFVVDDDGLKVIDVTQPAEAHVIEGATVRLNHARDVYVARTYAYVADGADGVAVVDVSKPEQPRLDQTYNASGAITDAHQVKVAMTNASLYAYVADGLGGLKVLQLTDPETMETYAGFSPRPEPRLIATFKTKGAALAVSKGLDRDRAVDESGNQLAVFGRRGARPFNLAEQRRMFITGDQLFTVTNAPPTPALNFKITTASATTGTDRENSVEAAATNEHVKVRAANLFLFASTQARPAATLGVAALLFVCVCWCVRWRARCGAGKI
jgi:hypothetical protein